MSANDFYSGGKPQGQGQGQGQYYPPPGEYSPLLHQRLRYVAAPRNLSFCNDWNHLSIVEQYCLALAGLFFRTFQIDHASPSSVSED